VGDFFRVIFLILLWLLLIGSGLCVALSAAFSIWQVSLGALIVGLACWFGIQAMKKNKTVTPSSPGQNDPS